MIIDLPCIFIVLSQHRLLMWYSPQSSLLLSSFVRRKRRGGLFISIHILISETQEGEFALPYRIVCSSTRKWQYRNVTRCEAIHRVQGCQLDPPGAVWAWSQLSGCCLVTIDHSRRLHSAVTHMLLIIGTQTNFGHCTDIDKIDWLLQISLRVLSLQTHRVVMRRDANRKRDILPQVVEVLFSHWLQ